MVRLNIEEDGRVRTVQLPDGHHVVGRSLDADVRLESNSISREHAALDVRNDQVWVEDLGSVWGTFLGNRRLMNGDRRPFPPGELLRLARVQVWSYEGARPEPPPWNEPKFDPTGGSSTGPTSHSRSAERVAAQCFGSRSSSTSCAMASSLRTCVAAAASRWDRTPSDLSPSSASDYFLKRNRKIAATRPKPTAAFMTESLSHTASDATDLARIS